VEVASPPAVDASAVTPSSSGDRSGDRQAALPNVATVLAILCVLALAGTLWLGLWLNHRSDEISQADQDRADVVAAAQRFTETWNTFKPNQVSQYINQVSPLLTTKFRTQFNGASQDVIQGIQQQQLSSKGKVLTDGEDIPLVGIASIDPDSAEVLVVSDAQRVAGGQAVLRHWRWQISLEKVDGKWLVDEFKEV
jgi:hypothetical protein